MKRKETRDHALDRLRDQADDYRNSLTAAIIASAKDGTPLWEAIRPLLTEFSKLRVAVTSHLAGEK